jgi:hypothetical protein
LHPSTLAQNRSCRHGKCCYTVKHINFAERYHV